MSLRSILFGTAIMSSVRVLRLAAQFVAIPILARLLDPAQYGLVAIAMPFALFAMMIADAGIGMSLVRVPLSNRTEWSTCFWISALLGVVLGAIMAALGPLAAHIFHEPSLAHMLYALAFVVMAQATHLIPIAAMQQAKRFKTIAAVEVCTTLTGLVVAVYMAYHGYGAWALIGQQVSFFAVRISAILVLSPFRPQLRFDLKSAHDHLHFGKNVLGNSLLQYFARSADSWIVGKMLGTSIVGVYSMAFQFARLPIMTLSTPLQYVLYADLVRMKDNPAAIAKTFLLITRAAAIAVFPAVGLVAAAHTPVFELLLSAKWEQAGFIFMILAPACALQSVTVIGETVLYSLGHTKQQMRCTLEYTILWIVALLATVSFGLVWAAIAYTACTLLYQLRYMAIVLRLLGIPMRAYLKALLTPLLATLAAALIYDIIAAEVNLHLVVEAAVAAVLALAAMGTCIYTHREALLSEWRKLRARKAVPMPAEETVSPEI